MTDSLGVNIRKRTEKLVDVELDLEYGHGGLEFVEIARCSIDCFGDVLEHEVEVDFVLLMIFAR